MTDYSPQPGTDAGFESQQEQVPAPPAEAPPERTADDISVAELIGQFFRTPAKTWAVFADVIRTPARDGTFAPLPTLPPRPAPAEAALEPLPRASSEDRARWGREAAALGLRIAAFIVVLIGSSIMAANRTESAGLVPALPLLGMGALLWVFSEAVVWNSTPKPATEPAVETDDPQRAWMTTFVLGGAALALSLIAYASNINNRFTAIGVITWIGSVVLWLAALSPATWTFGRAWETVRSVAMRHVRFTWTFWVLLVIMLVAGFFRFYDLAHLPGEMTSDHVEKVLDAQNVVKGVYQVFFPNNGGRDAIQFYTLALLSHFPGLQMNFDLLKLLTVLEGLISIPLLWWLGREVVGEEDPRLGNLVGLALAALVAVSYWHTMLSRLGLRIVLTVSFTTVLMVFLARALRHNRRADFLKAGLTLGIGLYAYQAVRMLPVVIVVGFLIALLFKARTWLDRGRYVLNMAALVIVAFAVFVPLFEFSVQYPDSFWMRTSGRLLGDAIIQETNAEGQLVKRYASIQERLGAFQKNLPVLMSNLRNAVLMYNWKGDVAWINGAPNRPEMDIFTGSLLILGVTAWVVRMVRRRDVFDWLLIPMLFIMLLPSALSIAYPVENPSATRTSGSLPEAYLLAALPLALVAYSIIRLAPRRLGWAIAAAVGGVVVLAAFQMNYNTYFDEYRATYLIGSLPYSEAGQKLREFADSGAGMGNAFMVAYQYWWDHRALGMAAGVLDWPNGIVKREDIPKTLYQAAMRSNDYHLNVDQPLLFFYSPADEDTQNQLQAWFPNGYWEEVQSYQPEDRYRMFHVPPLGMQTFVDFLVKTGVTLPSQ
jgi:hypothetical protein